MVPVGPSEYTVGSDSKKPVNPLTILLRFIIRDKRVGDGVRTQEGTGDARSKYAAKDLYIDKLLVPAHARLPWEEVQLRREYGEGYGMMPLRTGP